jgi:hypothetical protein
VLRDYTVESVGDRFAMKKAGSDRLTVTPFERAEAATD